jgi:hypothetical protein
MNKPYEVEIIVRDAKAEYTRHLEYTSPASTPEGAASEIVGQIHRAVGNERARVIKDEHE